MKFEQIPLLSGMSSGSHVHEYKTQRLAFLLRAMRECGPLARVVFLKQNLVVASGPEVLHEVMVEKARAFRKSPMLRLVLYPLAGDGLFTSEGEHWKRQRRLMSPMFRQDQIAGFAESMTAIATRCAATMRDGATVSVAQATTQIAMSVVGKALFDADTFDEADDLGHALTLTLAWADRITATPPTGLQVLARAWLEGLRDARTGWARRAAVRALDALETPVGYRLSPGDHPVREAVATIDARVARMVAVRRAAGLDRHDLLTQLLRACDEGDADGGTMTDRQIRDEAVTLFVAGHETTATALAWSMYELAKNPALAARVRAEADRFGGRTPAVGELGQLATCSRVFKEALRKYPPIYAIGRQALTDVTLGGYDVPRGTVVMASMYGLHHNPSVYPDPERFDPERFTPEAEAARHKSAWLPFSNGPRVCIGNHFALLEGQLVLAALAHRIAFEIPPGADVQPAPAATLRPGGGMPMIVRRRDAPRAAVAAPAA